MKLQDALRECTLALLRKIAASQGAVAGEDALRSELAELLHRRLLEPGYLAGSLALLSEEELRLLQTVRDQGWQAKAFVLERQSPRRDLPGGASGRGAPGPTLALLHRGILFRGFATMGSWRGEVYYVPDELQPLLAAALPPSAPQERPDLSSPRSPETVAERNVAFDLFCLLSFLRRENRRLARGSLSRSDLAKLEQEVAAVSSDLVVSRWEERWRFLLHLCLAGGWVKREGLSLVPARGAERLLEGGPGELRARLLERYLRDRGWSDLAAAGRVRQSLGTRQINEGAARRLLVNLLEESSERGWIDEDRFCEALRRQNPDFLREDYSSPSWAVLDTATDGELYGAGSWDTVEGEWVRYVLRGPLHWLGLIRWGMTRAGGAVGFQFLREPGGERDNTGSEGETGIALEDGLELVATADGDLAFLYRVEPYLELVQRQRVSRYRFTLSSVLVGLEKGGSWQELREMLRRLTPNAASTEVLDRVGEWASRYGRFLLEDATIVTAGTVEDAELLVGLPGVAACLGSRLGTRSFKIIPERAWELVERLRKSGYSPKVEPGVRLQRARRAAGDVELLRESLFALKLLHSLEPDLEAGSVARMVPRLEALLGPEETTEISRRVEAALRRLQRQ